uniref:Uncharacterized protein n=1 Tax=Mesocestoides corti TaxID=53468 RepID=A0A5K3F050_MESCO
MWGAQCGEPSQKLRTASVLRGRQCGVGLGRRHIGPRRASANPVSLCIPMACEEDKQVTREEHN